MDEIDQRQRIVERKLEIEEDAAAKAKEGASVQADENGFSISSADRQYQIRLRGLLQVDGRMFPEQSALNANDTFVVRRIRPILAGTLLGLVDFLFSPDFGNNTTAILDAYLDVHPRPWLRLRAGKFKQPLGLERLQADQDLVFIERALDSNLTPQREIGVELWGDVAGGVVRYEAGLFNGNPDGALNDVDNNYSKTFEGRVFVQPFNTEATKEFGRLGIGIAGSRGYEQGSAATPLLGGFKSAGQLTVFSYLATTTDMVYAFNRHTRLNPQLYYYIGPFGLLAEWVKEYQQLGKGSGDAAVNNSAGHVTASFVFGGDETYEGVKPRKPLDLAAGTFGALEIGVRYNWLDVDSVAFPTAADLTKSVSKAQGFGVALGWQLSRNLKLSSNYEQTFFTGGAKAGDRATEKALIGRFQAAF